MTAQPGRLAAYWERRLDKMDERELRHSRRLPGWRTRRHRRVLTAALVVADLALIVGASIFTTGSDWLFGTLWLGSILVGGGTFVLLRILTGRMSGGFSRLLDEREREWRHRVTYVGFQILSYLMIVAMIYGLVVAGTEDGGFRGVMMMSALLVTGTTIPTIVLGWSLPDDDPEDFEEGMGNA
jgi:MFS family permease